jgi:hypothetical protein
LIAGLIVTLVGVGLVATRTFGLPREWTTLLTGLVLLGAAGARRLLSSPR